jgi:hypothetical protein
MGHHEIAPGFAGLASPLIRAAGEASDVDSASQVRSARGNQGCTGVLIHVGDGRHLRCIEHDPMTRTGVESSVARMLPQAPGGLWSRSSRRKMTLALSARGL